jgi:hypothetical protein
MASDQLTAEWDRGATPVVWEELDRYRQGLKKIQEARAALSKLNIGAGSDLQFGSESGRLAALDFAIQVLTGEPT